MKKKEGLPIPENQSPLDKLLAHLDAKTIALLVAVLGSNGAWGAKIANEAPSVPLDQYTSVVTVLTQERANAVTALEDCKATVLKREKRRGK